MPDEYPKFSARVAEPEHKFEVEKREKHLIIRHEIDDHIAHQNVEHLTDDQLWQVLEALLDYFGCEVVKHEA
jgi:hypothetical protein